MSPSNLQTDNMEKNLFASLILQKHPNREPYPVCSVTVELFQILSIKIRSFCNTAPVTRDPQS